MWTARASISHADFNQCRDSLGAAALTAINSAANNALTSPDLVERVAKLALKMGAGSEADLASLQDAGVARWAR